MVARGKYLGDPKGIPPKDERPGADEVRWRASQVLAALPLAYEKPELVSDRLWARQSNGPSIWSERGNSVAESRPVRVRGSRYLHCSSSGTRAPVTSSRSRIAPIVSSAFSADWSPGCQYRHQRGLCSRERQHQLSSSVSSDLCFTR
jgi:hypothetical protein